MQSQAKMFRLGHRDNKNENNLGHRDNKNADKMLGHRDTKNADRLGHRDIKNVENKKMGEERRKVGIRSRRPLKLPVA